MAKKPRMGRNLDALLGSARTRRDTASEASGASAQVVAGNESSAHKPVPLQESEQLSVTGGNESIADTDGFSSDETTPVTQRGDRLRMLGVDQVRRGSYQPRRHFDQGLLEELAASIKTQGMIQPILVRPFAGAYELIAGERRWRAAQLAGLGEIPAIVRELDDQSVAAVSLIENIQRKDLNPLEEAQALERLCREFGMTHQSVADSVGRSRASVSNLMRLLDLHDEVKVMIDRGELDMGHARALLGAPRDEQIGIARQIVKSGLTVRATEKLVKDLKDADDDSGDKTGPGNQADPDIERLSRKLGEILGAPVNIRHKPNGAGKLEIGYTTVAELEGILAHMK